MAGCTLIERGLRKEEGFLRPFLGLPQFGDAPKENADPGDGQDYAHRANKCLRRAIQYRIATQYRIQVASSGPCWCDGHLVQDPDSAGDDNEECERPKDTHGPRRRWFAFIVNVLDLLHLRAL